MSPCTYSWLMCYITSMIPEHELQLLKSHGQTISSSPQKPWLLIKMTSFGWLKYLCRFLIYLFPDLFHVGQACVCSDLYYSVKSSSDLPQGDQYL